MAKPSGCSGGVADGGGLVAALVGGSAAGGCGRCRCDRFWACAGCFGVSTSGGGRCDRFRPVRCCKMAGVIAAMGNRLPPTATGPVPWLWRAGVAAFGTRAVLGGPEACPAESEVVAFGAVARSAGGCGARGGVRACGICGGGRLGVPRGGAGPAGGVGRCGGRDQDCEMGSAPSRLSQAAGSEALVSETAGSEAVDLASPVEWGVPGLEDARRLGEGFVALGAV